MGVYYKGYGAAFTTSMKLWHVGSQQYCPGQAWGRPDGWVAKVDNNQLSGSTLSMCNVDSEDQAVAFWYQRRPVTCSNRWICSHLGSLKVRFDWHLTWCESWVCLPFSSARAAWVRLLLMDQMLRKTPSSTMITVSFASKNLEQLTLKLGRMASQVWEWETRLDVNG